MTVVVMVMVVMAEMIGKRQRRQPHLLVGSNVGGEFKKENFEFRRTIQFRSTAESTKRHCGENGSKNGRNFPTTVKPFLLGGCAMNNDRGRWR